MASDFDHLESTLAPVPLFPVEAPGKAPADLAMRPELARQKAFIAFLRKRAPLVSAFAIPNAAKRGMKAMNQAQGEGMRTGAFDTCVGWDVDDSTIPDAARSIAFCEFKGFSADGRPGKLSNAQIEFGNEWHRKGHAVACFYTASAALSWLRSLGAPIPEARP